ncbi:hypothetical protein AGMMS49546_17950 [Spirochaetia bacterium]|nr:hypothetical protein AGMMS49546_17950 [Spirochaetia bacterium]
MCYFQIKKQMDILHARHKPYQRHFGATETVVDKHVFLYYIYTCGVSMVTKLTLTMDKPVIEQAKVYARKKNTSVSRIVEEYLEILINEERPYNIRMPLQASPLLDSMTGIVHDDGRDYKELLDEARMNWLKEKGFTPGDSKKRNNQTGD